MAASAVLFAVTRKWVKGYASCQIKYCSGIIDIKNQLNILADCLTNDSH